MRIVLISLTLAGSLHAAEIAMPVPADPRLDIKLFAAEPDIVTPIGIAIDPRSRIFVVESHTHQVQTNYTGPKSDRVKLFTAKPDGSLDKSSIFAEGFRHAMNLAFSPAGQLYLVHRNGVIILRDPNGDGVCDEQKEIVRMETAATYPHNGLHGIAFGPDGWLYLGTGENYGEPYTLHGSDGSRWRGTGGDGANVFRCRPDGSRVELFARGAWNLFSLSFDRNGNLFAVDNDPDGRPPCRLLHVVQGGNYGYQYRLGRHGLHPFQAWDGELPGTLPMVTGTGEAPSGIWRLERAALPAGYQDTFLVTSWGDHFLEIYRPQPRGASFSAKTEILVRGDEGFRPVAIATTPEGVLYVTDWVDRSYPVHGQGRIWRISARPGVKTVAPKLPPPTPAPNPDQRRMGRLLSANSPREFPDLLKALTDRDPFIRSAAIHALAKPAFRAQVLQATTHKDAPVRLGALLALRRAAEDWAGEHGAMWRGPPNPEDETVLRRLASDPDEEVRFLVLAWIAEAGLTSIAGEIEVAFQTGAPSAKLFNAYVAAAEMLADPSAAPDGRPRSPAEFTSSRAKAIENILTDTSKPAVLRAMSLAMLSDTQREKHLDRLKAFAQGAEPSLALEAVRTLADSTNVSAAAVLKPLALDARKPASLRAEAILALARQAAPELKELDGLLNDRAPAVRAEAARALRSVAERSAGAQPANHDAWRKALRQTGDAGSGRWVFFSPAVNCSKCHQVQGRGGAVGPNLSTIARSSDREKLIASILEPSREIGPLYEQHVVETKNGETISGVWVNLRPEELSLNTPEAGIVAIPNKNIVSHTVTKLSLMPEGLENALTIQDFRDLLAFLLSLK